MAKYESKAVPPWATQKDSREKLKPTKQKPGESCPSPDKIVSIYLQRYEKSKQKEWTYYVGLGWTHAAESGMFMSDYAQCHVTHRFFKVKSMHRTRDGLYINNEEIKSGRWFIDALNGRAYPKDRRRECFGNGNSIVYICDDNLESQTFVCDFDHKRYLSGLKANIRESEKYKVVCTDNLEQAKIKSCPECGHYFDGDRIAEHGDIGLGWCSCNRCYEAAIVKTVIREHNSHAYPEPIYTKRKIAVMEPRDIDDIAKRKLVYKNDTTTHPAVRLFGVEAEVEINQKSGAKRHAMALNAIKALGKDFVMCKHDGSLAGTGGPAGPELGGQYGFEIVSAPADLEEHRKRWYEFPKMEGYKHLRSWDTNTCGFHIHVSKAPLTTLQVSRILVFMNHPNNKKFVQKVAGRSAEKYCRYYPKTFKDGIHRPSYSDENRRQAINTVPEHTVEFRIFRGTHNPRHIIRNIEFVDAVVSYCHPCSRSVKELMNWKCFVEFCGTMRKEWPRLCEWMVLHDLLKTPKLNKKADKDKLTLRPDLVEEPTDPAEPKHPTKTKVLVEDF